jgi:hypothetical protein
MPFGESLHPRWAELVENMKPLSYRKDPLSYATTHLRKTVTEAK